MTTNTQIGKIPQNFADQRHVKFIGKKVKRTGEASLFSEQTGKLTDEATNMCRSLGIDTKDLYPKYVNQIRPLHLNYYNLLIMC